MNRKLEAIIVVIIILVLGVAACAVLKLYEDTQKYREESETDDSVREIAYIDNCSGTGSDWRVDFDPYDPIGPHPHKNDFDWEGLCEINPDIIGWLIIDHCGIDNPVVQSIGDEYLHKNFYGAYQFTGTVYMNNLYNSLQDRNIVLYGHSMNDKSLFYTLRDYMYEEQMPEEKYFWFITPEHVYRCDIFSMYQARSSTADYNQTEFTNIDEFKEFIDKRKDLSWIDFDVPVSSTDQILTISSCNHSLYGDDGRQPLHARLTEVE